MKKLKQGRYLSGPEQAKRFGYGMITPTLIVMDGEEYEKYKGVSEIKGMLNAKTARNAG